MNYYNEIDPYAAQWIRNLIAAGHIPAGVVDERSIEDVTPADLIGYTQCHFFAGIAGWSLALRLAGVPDDYPIWTGSCPCQPFSAAGQGAGFDDERHLWPAFHWLIQQCRPAGVVGEQVASKDADPWLDLVRADLEAMGAAFGAVAFPSAGVGAPHIRDRTYWVGDTNLTRLEGLGHGYYPSIGYWEEPLRPVAATSKPLRLAYCDSVRFPATPIGGFHYTEHHPQPRGGAGGVADTEHDGRSGSQTDAPEPSGNRAYHGVSDGSHRGLWVPRPSATNGAWRDADWLGCRDGKWRPVEPGTSPLAHGVSDRVGRLRAYGNAINTYQAAEFLKALLF